MRNRLTLLAQFLNLPLFRSFDGDSSLSSLDLYQYKRDELSALLDEWDKRASLSRISFPSNPTTASFIFLHGLGDTGEGWASSFYEWSREFPHIQFIFPSALQHPVTINNGMKMPAWYDITSLGNTRDCESIPSHLEMSIHYAHSLLLFETIRIHEILRDHSSQSPSIEASKRIILGGFSQGGALSLLAGHTYDLPLGGIVSLSGYIPGKPLLSSVEDRNPAQKYRSNIPLSNRHTPVLMGHGVEDDVVPVELGVEGFHYLSRCRSFPSQSTESSSLSNSLLLTTPPPSSPPAFLKDTNMTFLKYPMMRHEANSLELHHLKEFLATYLPKDI